MMIKKIYMPLLLLAFFVLASVILIPSVILWHSGEMWSKEALVKHQIKHDALVGYGLVDEEEAYKKTLYKTLNPEIIMIGSSRVLQFKAEMFSRPFLNMGRGLDLYDLKNEVKILTDNPNLKTVLFGIDYWNFGHHFCEAHANYNATEQAVGVNSANISKFSNLIPREILNVWPMILDGRVSLSLFLKYASEFLSDDGAALNKRGLRALYSNKGGFLKDGSYVFMNPEQMVRGRENKILNIIEDGAPYHFSKTERFCNKALSDLLYLKKTLDEKGITLIAFLPPLPERHTRLVTNTQTSLEIYNSMTSAFKSLKLPVEDYLNPDVVVYSDKEFIDEIHPSEVISSRILHDLASKNPIFADKINQSVVQDQINLCAGQVICSHIYSKYTIPE